MTENPTPQNQTESKEIDLIDVAGKTFTGIGNGLKSLFLWLGKILNTFFRFSLKFWWILLIATILGGIAGMLRDNMARPYFQAEMLAVASEEVDRTLVANLINSLQPMIDDHNYAFLSQQLSLPVSSVSQLSSVRADIADIRVPGRPMRTIIVVDRDGVETEEIVAEPNPQVIRVRIETWENTAISDFTNAIVGFVENNPFIAEQIDIAKRINLAQQRIFEREIAQLTALQQRNIEQAPMLITTHQGSLPVVVDRAQTFFHEIVNFTEMLTDLQREYELMQRPLRVVQPFFPAENPVDRRSRNILKFALLFFALCYTTLQIRENAKKRA